MVGAKYAFVISVIAVTCLTSVSGLTCYYCDSVENSCTNTKKLETQVCGYNSTALHLNGKAAKTIENMYEAESEKASGDWVCMKIVAKYKTDSKYETLKECSPAKIQGKESCEASELTLTAQGFKVKSCNTCTKDFCNAATSLTLQSFLIFSSILLIFTKVVV